MHVYRRSNGCVRGAAGRKLLVVSSSNGSSILGTEQEHLNQGVAEEEEAAEMLVRDIFLPSRLVVVGTYNAIKLKEIMVFLLAQWPSPGSPKLHFPLLQSWVEKMKEVSQR